MPPRNSTAASSAIASRSPRSRRCRWTSTSQKPRSQQRLQPDQAVAAIQGVVARRLDGIGRRRAAGGGSSRSGAGRVPGRRARARRGLDRPADGRRARRVEPVEQRRQPARHGTICAVENATSGASVASRPSRQSSGASRPGGRRSTRRPGNARSASSAVPSLEASTRTTSPRPSTSSRNRARLARTVPRASIAATTTATGPAGRGVIGSRPSRSGRSGGSGAAARPSRRPAGSSAAGPRGSSAGRTGGGPRRSGRRGS